MIVYESRLLQCNAVVIRLDKGLAAEIFHNSYAICPGP